MEVGYSLLGFLGVSPNYGYELKKQYDNYFGADKPVLSGQIYSTLSRLLRDGTIKEVEDSNQSGGPKRVKYELTSLGNESLQKWLVAPEKPSLQLQPTMYIKTVTALLNDGDASVYLDCQRHSHIELMRQLTAKRRQSELAEKIRLDHTLYHIEADLRWIELTSARLNELKEGLCQK